MFSKQPMAAFGRFLPVVTDLFGALADPVQAPPMAGTDPKKIGSEGESLRLSGATAR